MQTDSKGIAREPGKVPGVPVELGGAWYIIPPLNLAAVEIHEENILKVQDPAGDLPLKEKMHVICEVLLSAIQRNYPEVDLAFVKKWVDLGNVMTLFQAVIAVSGYAEAPLGEMGRAHKKSTGRSSTPASLPLSPAGPGSTSPTT